MTWQGGGSGAPGGPPDDDTQVSWSGPPAAPDAAGPGPEGSPAELPLPPAPPPAPAAPAVPGTYTYPAEIPAAPPPGAVVPPGGTWQPPAVPSVQPGGLKFGGVLPRLLAYWLDSIIVTIIVALIGGILAAAAGSAGFDSFVITTVLTIGVYALYFIGFWTGGSRATPGMRLFHLQIGQAADGRTLSMSQAVIRWAALGYPFTLLGIVPALAVLASGLLLLWEILLLASTALSPTRQGLHDRLAGSAIVAPEGNEGPVIPCLVLAVVLFVVLPVLAAFALIAVGMQIQEILTEVGSL